VEFSGFRMQIYNFFIYKRIKKTENPDTLENKEKPDHDIVPGWFIKVCTFAMR
jgi:hypothetical protein